MSTSTQQALSGFTAGAVSTAMLHPLDLVKTRFQVNETAGARLSLMRSLADISRQEGVRSLYRGLSANMAGATSSWGLYFWWYAIIKDWMRTAPDGTTSTAKLSATQHLIASAEAGMLTSLLTNPFWLIKTRMCTQKATDPGAYRNVFDGLRQVVRAEGFFGLYRGIVPALIGVSHGALQFMAYEEMKHMRMELVHGADIEKLGTLEYITMAAASKIFATVCTYPYQVVKSRMQVQTSYVSKEYSGVISTVTSIVRGEGLAGLYKGMGVNIVRVLPGTCITFAVYEGMSKLLRNS
ncbi:mitochondrial FAD carrier protein flx1 [Polyrhizophydium stewartii]|uniref:Mitochondrial FAD carrier protein flx1 n=1 Tax=Polyrhizophydium stewartii TaxID=2732419 RepID=A0ABR4N642_9FUNG